jgi:RHS repeat-associated protein
MSHFQSPFNLCRWLYGGLLCLIVSQITPTAFANTRIDVGEVSRVEYARDGVTVLVTVSYSVTSRQLYWTYNITNGGGIYGGAWVATTTGLGGPYLSPVFDRSPGGAGESNSGVTPVPTDQWFQIAARVSSGGEAHDKIGYFHCYIPSPPTKTDSTKQRDQNSFTKDGGAIQLETGAESTSRPLFSFHGARNWGVEIHYNSNLAAVQPAPSALGFGWTHDFESSIEVSGSNLILHWDAGRANTFTPVAGQTGVYSSNEDASRYDTITSQPGGGWLLVRKDQSSRRYNAGGALVEDRDPSGRTLILSYTLGSLTQIVDPISNTSATFAYDSAGTLSSITDATNASVNFAYGVSGSRRVLSSITNQNGKTATWGYGSNVDLVTLTDHNGVVLTTNTYDIAGRVVTQVNATGSPYGFTYGTYGGNPMTVVNRNGVNTTYYSDSNYYLAQLKDPLGNYAATYTRDHSNQVTEISDALSHVTHYAYDVHGNLLTATDPAGKVTTYTYDASNNLLTSTDPASQVTTYTYDASNNLLTRTDALNHTTTWTYDSNSLPLTMTLPGGGVYHYAYTAGRLTQSTDPNGVITKFGYDADGRLLYREDALGKRVTYTYDAIGNVRTITNALSQTSTYTYDHRNRMVSATDPAGAVTSYTYDHDNKLLTKTDARGKVTTYAYDGEDRLLTITDALNRTTSTTYDASGRLTKVTDPAGNATSFEYDAASQLTAVTDARGRRTVSAYDVRGLLTSATDPLSRKTAITYDDVGRRLTVTDPLNRTTHLTYDALNRLNQVTDPGSLVASQGFDADGNRTSLTNPAANATAFAYDVGGRLTSTTTPEGHATSLSYDARGLPASVSQPSGHATTFAYDAAAQVSSLIDNVGTIALARDNAGRVVTVTESGKSLTRVYDALGRVTSFTDGDGNVIGYQYDDIGRLTKLTYPDSKQVSYTYDTAGRLSTVTDWASRTTTYSYDAVGQVAQILRPNGTKQTRTYDAAGQLTQLRELAADGVTLIYSGDHTYDVAGQLVGEVLFPALTPALVNTVQTFDRDNRLLTHNGAATTFDADGNLLTIASGVAPASYTYDARNRLTSAGGISYTYDAENRRVALTDGAGTTHYAINPNATLDQVLVRTAPNGTKTFYVYGLGLLHEETGSTVRYYHHDRRGDTVALTDGTGAVTDRANYGVYGELISRTGTTNTPFLFNGRWGVQTDSNGIYYHRARYYHPALRRFLNQDTVLGSIASSLGLNRFAYANGNPVTGIDPFGLMKQDVDPDSGGDAAKLREIQGLFKTDRQKAIDEAVKYYKIDISSVTDGGPVYYARLIGEGDTVWGRVRIGPDAFEYGPEWLGSSIGHESEVHAKQEHPSILERSWDRVFHSSEFSATGYYGQLDAMHEVEAYSYEIKNQGRYGTTQPQIENLERRRNSHYELLTPENKALADRGSYTPLKK